jgi:hypothetical protein
MSSQKGDFDRILHLIKHGNVAEIRNQLDAGINPNIEHPHGWTPLMLAATEGNTAIGRLLIARGATINSVTHTGATALSLAVIRGHVRFLKLLLEHGADPDAEGHRVERWLPACRHSPKTDAAILSTIQNYREQNSN